MLNFKKAALFLGVSCAATGVSSAYAQAPDTTSALARDQNTSVRERARPEYDPLGVRAGAFMLYPMLDVGVSFDDNIFSSPVNEQSDTIYTIAPSARLVSNWLNHELALFANAKSRIYSDFDTFNSTDWTAGGDARIDIVRNAYLTGSLSYTDAYEPLYDNPNSGLREPVQYSLLDANVGAQWELARTRVGVFVDNKQYDFEDGVLMNGATFNQDDRDRTVTQTGARVDFAVSPDTALFAAVQYNVHDYDQMPPAAAINRNSDGYQALVGVNFDLTRLMRGEIGIGVMSQSFDAPGIADTEEMTGSAKVEWFPTELLTITANASRYVGDPGVFGAAGVIATRASLTADYELLRNVILTAEGAIYKDDYQGLNRDDDRWRGSLSGEYKLNRVLGVYADYTHWNQESSGTALGRDYQENILSLGVRLRR